MPRRRKTLIERVITLLKKHREFVSLKYIYHCLRAVTVSQQAQVRGVLNHNCGNGDLFIRSKSTPGMYRVRRSLI